MNKIPVEVLLKFSRQEVEELKGEIKKFKEEREKLILDARAGKNYVYAAKREAKKEELYIELKRQIKALEEKYNKLEIRYNRVLEELKKYNDKFGKL